MISFFKRKRSGATFVLGILGDYGRVESALARSVERLEEIARRADCRIVAAWDDSRWETVPLVQTLGMRFPRNRLTAFCGDCPDEPATLFSAAAARAEGEFLQFLWPGCLPDLDAVESACAVAAAQGLDGLGFVGSQTGLPEHCAPNGEEQFSRVFPSHGRPFALCQAIVRRTSFLAMNGFRKSPLLQRAFDADYWLRSVRSGQNVAIRAGTLAAAQWAWEDFPLQKDLRVPHSLSHSYRMRTADCPGDAEETKVLDAFAADLPPAQQGTVQRLTGAKIASRGDRLTLALFSHTPHLCGAERMLLNLAILLERSKTVQPVLLIPGEGALIAAARRHGLHAQIIAPPPWYLLPPDDLSAYGRGVDACREELKKTLIDLHSDAVLVNTMTSVPAMLAAVELDLPSLLWVHGVIDSLLLPGRSSEFAAAQDALLLHSATRVIALPNYTAEFCTRVMHRTALDIIPNWTQVDRQFAVPQDKYCSRQIACLNTFDAHKGHATLIEAAALLNARNVSFELKLYGDGPLRDTWQRQIGASGLQDCVRFPGRTTDVEQVYDQSLCVVNPADAEPFPMTLIEPLARKTPVVATRSGGATDIVVDGQCGYLVERGDAAGMADRLQALLASPALAQSLGDCGHARACSHFSEEVAEAAFLPLIAAAVHDFRGYDPAVKSLVKLQRLWLALSSAQRSPSVRGVSRLAKGGLRRARALGRRVMTALGVHGDVISSENT